jgi:hypothetical protein
VDDGAAPPAERGDTALPKADAPSFDSERSLIEDVEALIDDGKTYLEAEIAYQKTRAVYVTDKAKSAVVYGALAAAFGFLALVGLTIGLIIALTPLLTAWGASALVVGLLAIGAALAGRAASERWNSLMNAIETAGDAGGEGKP